MMRESIYTPLILAMGATLVLGAHNHHKHHHGKIKPHVQMEPRDLNWIDHVPADMNVEIRTLTTTVFKDCIPTNTRYVTTTIFEDYPEPTAIPPKPIASQELPMAAIPRPLPVESVLEPATATIQAIPPKFSAIEAPQQPVSSITSETASQFEPMDLQSNHIEASVSQTLAHEETTTIHMTKTITDMETAAPSVSNSKPASSSNLEAPSPSETSAEERPLPNGPKTDSAPHNPNLLQSIPKILPDNPTDILPHLPVSGLDNVLHPDGPAIPEGMQWTDLPANNDFSTRRFGGHSKPAGTLIEYHGNVGVPWGSNIIEVSPTEAHRYKYVAQFTGSNTEPWTVIVWNKIGPDGKMDGWYGNSALTFILAPDETKYIAFDEDSIGAWGAAPGTKGLPTDDFGGYTSTWGEFSFGDIENNGWSGWDVSAIQAQIAKQKVEGMRICMADGKGCSILTPGAKKVINAYTESKKHHDGIGGAAPPGPVRLAVDLDYTE
ncbi:hypothetical protein N7481_003862 [Penicillium waksmanii]|uniref:uncharacterized protein n=1 Tax=Penicillium waksmanii TaxID=69791 RepID=UPI0025480A1C|nr:uncharacterized protein N7481_003862 [Penicillium waksmanii]KAJ5988652.1 hypothetical protein N7481_003862 [Penicillium waksmanii]